MFALGSSCFQIVLRKQHGSQCPAQMIFHIVGQHAQKDMCHDPVLGAMVNGTHLQRHGFHRAEGHLHRGKTFVIGDQLGRVRPRFQTGTDGVQAIESVCLHVEKRLNPIPHNSQLRDLVYKLEHYHEPVNRYLRNRVMRPFSQLTLAHLL